MTFHADHLVRDHRSRSPSLVPFTQETADAAFDAGKMRVYVNCDFNGKAGKAIFYDFDGKDTIGIVKAKIHAKEGIPIEQQLLSLELPDSSQRLETLGALELDMVLTEQPDLALRNCFKITVKYHKRFVANLDVKASDTIGIIKAMIERETEGPMERILNGPTPGVPRAHQRLTFALEQLEDGKTLSDYGIENCSVIYLDFDGGWMPLHWIQ